MERKSIFLLPGELVFVRNPTIVSTLLGSCVAVCLYDKKNNWGGMNHYMLPSQNDGSLEPGKYGEQSINKLLLMAAKAGCSRSELVASIFGGGNVVGHLGSLGGLVPMGIGNRNIDIAHSLLSKHSIRVTGGDTGGELGRKIRMNTATNEIKVEFIQRSNVNIQRAEKLNTFKGREIKVLVIDDSQLVRKILIKGIEAADNLTVVGEAENPYEAREMLLEKDPDVLCLDVIMPKMDGITFLKKIMQYKPIPTVIVSTITKRGNEMWEKARKAGAVDIVDKEELKIYQGLTAIEQVLIPKLRRAAETVF